MQGINILRNNAFEFSGALQFSEEFMTDRWFDLLFQSDEIPREFEKRMRFFVKIIDIENGFCVVFFRHIQTLRTAEIRNPGAGGNAGAGEGDDGLGITKKMREFLEEILCEHDIKLCVIARSEATWRSLILDCPSLFAQDPDGFAGPRLALLGSQWTHKNFNLPR